MFVIEVPEVINDVFVVLLLMVVLAVVVWIRVGCGGGGVR